MKTKILIILGHPQKDSLCGTLAKSYRDGAAEAGAETRQIDVSDLDFDPTLHNARTPNEIGGINEG